MSQLDEQFRKRLERIFQAWHEGYEVLAKNAQDAKLWNMGIENIVGWLSSLRAAGSRKRGRLHRCLK